MTIDKGSNGLASGGREGPPGGGAGAPDGGQAAGGDGQPGGGDKAGSPIVFRLDPGSGVPTYLQLVQQVEHALRLGFLRPGDRLPTVKDTVAALAINPNTVLKAYRELEHRGLAAGRPGQGTFVERELPRVGVAEQDALRRSLLGWLATASEAGLDEEGMVALFTMALRDFRDRRPAAGKRPGPGRGSAEGAA